MNKLIFQSQLLSPSFLLKEIRFLHYLNIFQTAGQNHLCYPIIKEVGKVIEREGEREREGLEKGGHGNYQSPFHLVL